MLILFRVHYVPGLHWFLSAVVILYASLWTFKSNISTDYEQSGTVVRNTRFKLWFHPVNIVSFWANHRHLWDHENTSEDTRKCFEGYVTESRGLMYCTYKMLFYLNQQIATDLHSEVFGQCWLSIERETFQCKRVVQNPSSTVTE